MILAGPKSVTIHDTEIVATRDLGANFYCTEAHVGKSTRAQASLDQLSELNEYVKVKNHEGEITTDFLKNFDVVVFTNTSDRKFLIEMNEFCRTQEKTIGFIWAGSYGFYGWTFVDFGPSHTIFDHNGERCESAIVTSITNEEKGVVTVSEEKRHGYEDGDWVTFREIEGMPEINGQNFQIEVISPFSFTIGDTTQFGEYTREGIVEQIKVPIKMSFRSLREALDEPMNGDVKGEMMHNPDTDWMRFNRPYELHLALNAMLDFYEQNSRLPTSLNEEDVQAVKAAAQARVDAYKQANQEHDEKYKELPEGEEAPKKPSMWVVEEVHDEIGLIARFADTETAPFNSFWGGIVAQEIVKFTGKFSPLRQWLHYSVCDRCIPEGEVTREGYEDSRYRDQILLLGNEAVNRLRGLKIFMVGAGALGCEYLKQFALMGACTSGDGLLTVTDDDCIEISNLNRQFLFRRKHVGCSKAETASQVAQGMNSDFKVDAHKARAEPNTENTFTDVFWDDLDCVFGAVDNIKARQYVDSKCVLHHKTLIESGTLGTKCNSQMVIPHKTQCYSDSQDPEEKSIPMCTLRNYPYLLDHTIEWSRDYFQGLCCDGSADFAQLVRDPEGYITRCIKEAKGQTGTLLIKFRNLSKFLIGYPEINTQSLVNIGRQLFQDIFHDQIVQLLYCFPRDAVREDGNLFWSAPKRCPTEIPFDADDEMHFLFIRACLTIFSDAFKVQVTETDDQIRELARNAPFVVKEPTKMKIKTGEDDETEEAGPGESDEIELDQLVFYKFLNIFLGRKIERNHSPTRI